MTPFSDFDTLLLPDYWIRAPSLHRHTATPRRRRAVTGPREVGRGSRLVDPDRPSGDARRDLSRRRHATASVTGGVPVPSAIAARCSPMTWCVVSLPPPPRRSRPRSAPWAHPSCRPCHEILLPADPAARPGPIHRHGLHPPPGRIKLPRPLSASGSLRPFAWPGAGAPGYGGFSIPAV